MVTYVGSSWAGGPLPSGPLSWPAGTAAGDLGVLMLLTPDRLSPGGRTLVVPPGWTLAVSRTYTGLWWPSMWSPKTPTWEAVGVAWRMLTAADVASPLDLPVDTDDDGYSGLVTVWRDSVGVGAVRTPSAYLPVGEAGGVFCVYSSEGAGDTPDNLADRLAGFAVAPRHISNSGGQHAWTNLAAGWATTGPASPGLGALGRTNGMAVEILGPQPPEPPAWSAPADQAEMAVGQDLALALLHRPVVAGGKADAYRVQVAVVTGGGDGSGTPTWDRWLTAAGALSSTEQTLTMAPGTSVTALVGAALLAVGDRVVMRAQSREATDQRWSEWSTERTVYPVDPPATTVTGPTGTVTDDLTPTISFTVSGGPHASVQARIVGPGSTGVDDGVLWDSGVVTSAGLDITADVADYVQGGQHRAWVRVATAGGAWSPWASGPLFTMSWTPPAAPTVTAAYSPGADGITVTITGHDAGDEVDLQRLDPATGWVDVSRIGTEDDGPLVVVDAQAPYGVDVTYRARIRGDLDGAFVPGDWGTSGTARSLQSCSILVDAARPLSRWLRVRWSADAAHVHDQVMSVTHGIGDPRPRVAVGTYQGLTGTWTFGTSTVADRAELLGFLHSCEVMTLVTPPEREPGGGSRAVPHLTVRRASPLTVDRLAQVAISQRVVTMDWVEADPVTPVDTATGIAGGVLTLTGLTPGPGGTLLIEAAP